jgi:AcrR family transcriptional regulator
MPKPTMRQRAREAAATALLEAAEEVAAQRGLEATSIAAIAERAGVAVGTLYNYFPDREALIAALFRLRRAELLPRVVAAAEQTAALPFEQRLRGYLTAVFTVFEDYRRFCRVAMSADQGAVKAKSRGPSAVLAAIIEALTEILAARPVGPESGQLAPAPQEEAAAATGWPRLAAASAAVEARSVPPSAPELAHMLYGAMKAILHLRIERDLAMVPAATLLANTFLRGIPPR